MPVQTEDRRPFIREVILENFMSYDYGRLPLKPGLNVILGPNGSGKSSILLAISVALGQAYTERSRRLSDLVKRGKEIARVTLLLDNSIRNGKRPLPFRSDLIHLSRYIRKDGAYWFEIDFKEANKSEVTETLMKLGLNPDNMLIIMHQGIGDSFSAVPAQEKLSMVEDAVGLSSYRRSLLEAKERLEKIKSEEEERRKELEQANIALTKWQGEYEKLLKIKELRSNLDMLRVEEAWSKVAKINSSLTLIDDKLKRLGDDISSLESRFEEAKNKAATSYSLYNDNLAKMIETERKRERLSMMPKIENILTVKGSSIPDEVNHKLEDLKKELQINEESTFALDRMVSEAIGELENSLKELIEKSRENAVLEYRIGEMKSEERRIKRQKAEIENELQTVKEEANRLGQISYSPRQLAEIQAEQKLIELQLKELGTVPEEVEKLYNDYRVRIDELSSKLKELDENKRATMKEVEERFSVWRSKLKELIKEINERYTKVLSMINGNGKVMIVNEDNPIEAGLELFVSFRSDQLVKLDPVTQSGGERSSSVAAFLLALQGLVVSPFRAVDEMDVHMDRLNRQAFMKIVYEMFRQQNNSQYLVITPVEPEVYDSTANYIMVHKVSSASVLKQVKRAV
ncbi:MAG: AAA family ATPase [Conexivisphaerales archaeon]